MASIELRTLGDVSDDHLTLAIRLTNVLRDRYQGQGLDALAGVFSDVLILMAEERDRREVGRAKFNRMMSADDGPDPDGAPPPVDADLAEWTSNVDIQS